MTAVFEILNPTHQHVEDLSYLGDKYVMLTDTCISMFMNHPHHDK